MCKLQASAPIGTLYRLHTAENLILLHQRSSSPSMAAEVYGKLPVEEVSDIDAKDVGCAASRSAFALVSADVPPVRSGQPPGASAHTARQWQTSPSPDRAGARKNVRLLATSAVPVVSGLG